MKPLGLIWTAIFALILILAWSAYEMDIFSALPSTEVSSNQTEPDDPASENNMNNNNDENKKNDPESIAVEAEPEIRRTEATLAAAGDILIHSSIYRDAQTGNGFDFTPMFARVKPIIEQADIAFANQETMIGGVEIGLSDYPRFNSPFEVGDALKATGFDIVSMANNHTLDRGESAIFNAINHWNQLNMDYVGSYQSEEDRNRIRILEAEGIRFAFLAYSYGTNGLPVPEGKDYLINLIDPERMKEDVRQAKEQSDVVVVSLHFGQEYHPDPSEDQLELAQFLADEGVDIILGHHPHVLQPPQWLQGKDGNRSFVIYSLGNFIAAQDGLEKEIGGILTINIEKVIRGDEQQIHLKNPRFIPTWAFKQHYRNYDIIPYSAWDFERFPVLREMEKRLIDHMTRWVPELEIGEGTVLPD